MTGDQADLLTVFDNHTRMQNLIDPTVETLPSNMLSMRIVDEEEELQFYTLR